MHEPSSAILGQPKLCPDHRRHLKSKRQFKTKATLKLKRMPRGQTLQTGSTVGRAYVASKYMYLHALAGPSTDRKSRLCALGILSTIAATPPRDQEPASGHIFTRKSRPSGPCQPKKVDHGLCWSRLVLYWSERAASEEGDHQKNAERRS